MGASTCWRGVYHGGGLVTDWDQPLQQAGADL